MSADRQMRIGELARVTGTTVRTIRYYEEIGLLPGADARASGSHRTYTQQDADRLRDILRLKDLLGVSLEELRELVAAEDARATRRREFRADGTSTRRRAEILRAGLGNVERQRSLVRQRQAQLAELDGELAEREALILTRLDELGSERPAAPRAK
jgi:DNA-binding transcriptional MerR regulator